MNIRVDDISVSVCNVVLPYYDVHDIFLFFLFVKTLKGFIVCYFSGA